MKSRNICRIRTIEEIIKNVFDVTVESPEMAAQAKPGQFLHIDCGDAANNLLRRPISICDAEGDTVRFLFERKGSGTEALAEKKTGDTLDILGPLGNSFTMPDGVKKPIVIGGGIGIFPLYMLCKQLPDPVCLLGFRSKDRVCMEDEFASVAKTTVATDDGSYGYNGFAVNLLEEMLDKGMGCGIGACLVCTCETNSNGTHKHKRVCKNGPVFWSSEVTLNG